jgi:hypothetical protein
MEPETSLPYSHESSIGPYPEPVESSLHNQKLYLKLVAYFNSPFLAHFPYFEKKIGLWNHLPKYPAPINFWMPEPIFMELYTYIMAPNHISMA